MTRHQDMIRSLSSMQAGMTAEQLLDDIVYSLDNSAIVAVTDRTGKILYANEFFATLSKYPMDELIGANQSIVNSGYHPRPFFKEMWRTIGSGRIWRGDICNRAKDGALYWVDTTIVPFLDEHQTPYQYIAIRYNITEKKRYEAALQKQLELYQLITRDAGDYIAVLDRQGALRYASPSLEELLGVSGAELINYLTPADAQMLKAAAAKTMTEGGSPALEFSVRTDAAVYRMSGTLSMITGGGEFSGCCAFSFRDVTAEREQELMIHDLASTDQLTGLPNRHAFMSALDAEVEHAKRSGQLLGLAYVNIDKLRYANETRGYDCGDEVLRNMASRLLSWMEGGLCGRTAGDEFAVVLSGSRAQMIEKAQAVRKLLEQPVALKDDIYSATVSCGLSIYPEHAIEVPGLITTTEQAMQSVKRQGGSGFAVFTEEMYTSSLERIILENELRKSIRERHFVLEYQPKVDLALGHVTGFETLVRWQHPDLGRIPPDKFIAIAEETKVIVPLGEWILEEAFRKVIAFRQQSERPVTVAVNLSAVQLEQPGLIEFVTELTARTGIDPSWIDMEVTESALADRLEMGLSLRQLQELGFTVSIDDFGTGFSSFSYVQEFPADTLKIDRSFVKDIEHNRNSRAIVQAIVTMADTAGLKVVAEGIESEEQAAILKTIGCREGQGYYYSRPLPEDQALRLVSATAPDE